MNKKEELSISYISAICAYAGIKYEIIRNDDDSTDGLLRKTFQYGKRKYISVLRIQLKCTSSSSQYADNGDHVTYKLKVKNFNDLCTPSTTPIILGLLILPEEEKSWIKWSTEELLIKGCMYWADLSDNEYSDNSGTVTITLDKTHVINSENLCGILEKIAKGEEF